jgi:putative membrane protein
VALVFFPGLNDLAPATRFYGYYNGLKDFLQRWTITTLAVLVAANIVKGISYDDVMGLLAASLFLGILNAVVRPILVLLSVALGVVATGVLGVLSTRVAAIFAIGLVVFGAIGLLLLAINTALFYSVGWLIKSFHVATLSAAFWGSLIISATSMILNTMTGTGETRMRVHMGRPDRPGRRKDTGGEGPVIDV